MINIRRSNGILIIKVICFFQWNILFFKPTNRYCKYGRFNKIKFRWKTITNTQHFSRSTLFSMNTYKYIFFHNTYSRDVWHSNRLCVIELLCTIKIHPMLIINRVQEVNIQKYFVFVQCNSTNLIKLLDLYLKYAEENMKYYFEYISSKMYISIH